MASAAADWIEWTGGECPVPADTLVKVRFACDLSPTAGDEYPARPARFWIQAWRRKRAGNRITAYRVVQS